MKKVFATFALLLALTAMTFTPKTAQAVDDGCRTSVLCENIVIWCDLDQLFTWYEILCEEDDL